MSHALIAHLHDLLDGMGRVTTRAMFGGHGVYLEGALIDVVIEEALYLKADDETRLHFEAAGSEPYIYRGQELPIRMSYWSVPESAMESAQAMKPWAELAYAAALRKTPSKRGK